MERRTKTRQRKRKQDLYATKQREQKEDVHLLRQNITYYIALIKI